MDSLWDVVRRDMGDGGPSGADGLGATVGAAWAAMAPRRCRGLVASVPCHVGAVIGAGGGQPSVECLFSVCVCSSEDLLHSER